MRELTIGRNDSEQRLDRYLKKYLNKANNSFIYKMLRKKNIKLNNSKAHADAILKEGDVIALYLSDETIDKFRDTSTKKRQLVNLDIILNLQTPTSDNLNYFSKHKLHQIKIPFLQNNFPVKLNLKIQIGHQI